jgi:hypothetical protein
MAIRATVPQQRRTAPPGELAADHVVGDFLRGPAVGAGAPMAGDR